MNKPPSNFAVETRALPVHVEPTAESVKWHSPREKKEAVARKTMPTLEAAIRAGDWKNVQAAADNISQMAQWLQMSDEEIAKH